MEAFLLLDLLVTLIFHYIFANLIFFV
jgi:hypothetical protein